MRPGETLARSDKYEGEAFSVAEARWRSPGGGHETHASQRCAFSDVG